MTFKVLDAVVLNRDLPRNSLERGDLGAVVELFDPDALEVEFVTVSGKTEVIVTLRTADVRGVEAHDLITCAATIKSAARQK